MSSEPSEEEQVGRGMHVAALASLPAGAIGSVGLTLYAGLRIGAPRVLLVLFAGWVVFPFGVLAVGYLLSRRRSVLAKLALCRAILSASLGSLALYGIAALGAARPTTAVFVLVAPLSLLVVGFIVAMTVFGGGKGQ